jgi:hypothetical protein
MFPWLMPTMGGQLSLISMLQGGGAPGSNPQAYWARMMSPQAFFDRGYEPAPTQAGDRSDQTIRGNQPDPGNSMAPPGQQPPGGPDQNATMSPYDPNTVAPSYGYQPSPLMRLFANYRSPSLQQQQRGALGLGMYGLNMLQPRQPNIPQPYPWI